MEEKLSDLLKKIVDSKVKTGLIAGTVIILAVIGYFFIDKGDEKLIAEEGIEKTSDTAIEEQQEIYIIIEVAGAVNKPSVIELAEGSRVYEAIEAAGGLSENANIQGINQAAVLLDGERIYIPTDEEFENSEAEAGMNNGTSGFSGTVGSGTTNGKVNINTADSTGLQTLNGVGPATAEKIIRYREQNGRFKNIEEIKNVSGIGEKTFEKLKDYITI